MSPSSTSTPTSTPTRRLTRSQTATSVLGKRTSLSRSSSVVSNRSTGFITPDSTPIAKRKRTVTRREEDDGTGNKENIPPPPFSEISSLFDSPRSRLSRRSSFSSDISTVSTRSRNSVASSFRRSTTYGALSRASTPAFDSFPPVTPPPSSPSAVPLYLRVRGLLRTTSNSDHGMSMEGREAERIAIESFLHSLDAGSDVADTVLYVSGTPGTGKTALVNSIITSTKVADDVKIVFVNCMAITGMDALWEKLAEELGAPVRGRGAGKKTPIKDKVYAIFEKQKGVKCILVLDELDNLAATSANDLQSLFSLAASRPSMLRIMGIANTHTLTSASSMLPFSTDSASDASATPSSKGIKVKTIHFAPYSPTELLAILVKRFEELPQDELKMLLPTPTQTLLTKKVSALTGDVRVLFEVLRGAIDIAVASPSPKSTEESSETVAVTNTTVSPAHVLSALKAHAPTATSTKSKSSAATAGTAGNSEIVSKVRSLGLQQRLVLLALVLATKRLAATLPLSGTSSFASITPPSTPTKRPRSPVKRAGSSSSIGSSVDSTTVSFGIESGQLYTYYSSLLAASDAFVALSRSEFSDLLGILETTGLVSLRTQSSRSLKRSSSFAGSVKSANASGAQSASLAAHVREGEVVRGLGIGADAKNKSDNEGDALEDGVRSIWFCEMSLIRREAKAKATLSMLEGVEGFEDAIEA